MACSTRVVLADGPQPKVTPVEKRLLKIRLNVALQQYKKAYTQLSELRWQEASPQAGDLPEKEKKLMSRQEDFLTMQVDRLQSEAMELGKKLDQMEDSLKKAKGSGG